MTPQVHPRCRKLAKCLAWAIAIHSLVIPSLSQAQPLSGRLAKLQSQVVKITGAGGFQGLENYQTGLLIAADGFVLTVWSYVLDGDTSTVTLDDGRKYDARLVGFDPRTELALLKISEVDLPYFELKIKSIPSVGTRILALSNVYGVATGNEPISVLRGVIAGTGQLNARRGAKAVPYRDSAVFVDAITNNAGSAGGAVVDLQGNLLAVIGKEVEDARTGIWINYAIPVETIVPIVERIVAGKQPDTSGITARRPTESLTCELLGLELVPDVVANTPPYVESSPDLSPAAIAGIRPDDLIVEVNGKLVTSIQELRRRLAEVDRDAAVQLTIERGGEFKHFLLRPTR